MCVGGSCEPCSGDSSCGSGFICGAACDTCFNLCRNGVLDEEEFCDRSAPETGCDAGQQCATTCDVCIDLDV